MSEANKKEGSKLIAHKALFPDMKLYEEIIFLKYYFKGKFCVENVIGFYEPLIYPTQMANHYFWTNFLMPLIETDDRGHDKGISHLEERKGFDLSEYGGIDKRLALRNCVEPEIGRHILHYAMNPIEMQQSLL